MGRLMYHEWARLLALSSATCELSRRHRNALLMFTDMVWGMLRCLMTNGARPFYTLTSDIERAPPSLLELRGLETDSNRLILGVLFPQVLLGHDVSASTRSPKPMAEDVEEAPSDPQASCTSIAFFGHRLI
jgi:hypothetical protein